MKKTIGVLIATILIACNSNPESIVGHQLNSDGDTLEIRYSGEGDMVLFLMYQGLSQTLAKNTSGVFEGQLEIPNLDDGIFSYEIFVYKKDSLGNFSEIAYKPDVEEERFFIWIGDNRDINFSKATNLLGEVSTRTIQSSFLEEDRDVTVYNPKVFDETTPIIYLTDGSIVRDYAPYVDSLISAKRILPVKLVGVHSSREHRYKEYVQNGIENDFFAKHQDFFYKEVLNDLESETPNWKGQRYMYGVSNGGAFSMHVGINYPALFEEIIAFSTADYITEFIRPIEFKFETYPKFYLGAGRYEENFFQSNVDFVPKLKAQNIDVTFKEYTSGHDHNVWKFEFLEYLEKRFGI